MVAHAKSGVQALKVGGTGSTDSRFFAANPIPMVDPMPMGDAIPTVDLIPIVDPMPMVDPNPMSAISPLFMEQLPSTPVYT